MHKHALAHTQLHLAATYFVDLSCRRAADVAVAVDVGFAGLMKPIDTQTQQQQQEKQFQNRQLYAKREREREVEASIEEREREAKKERAVARREHSITAKRARAGVHESDRDGSNCAVN